MGILDEDFIGVVGKGKPSASAIPGGFVGIGLKNDFEMFPNVPTSSLVKVEPNSDAGSQVPNAKTRAAGLQQGQTAINPPVTHDLP